MDIHVLRDLLTDLVGCAGHAPDCDVDPCSCGVKDILNRAEDALTQVRAECTLAESEM
jgi:DNA-binding IscR family transcriptional regulator